MPGFALLGGDLREFATFRRNRRLDRVIPDFGDTDSPAKLGPRGRSPNRPGGGHILNSDQFRLLSALRLVCGLQQARASFKDRLPHALGFPD